MAVYPVCVGCWVAGRMEPATHVDHITPFTDKHDARRLDWDNLQSLCTKCHMGPKAAIQATTARHKVKAQWAAWLCHTRTCDDVTLQELPDHVQEAMRDNTTTWEDGKTWRLGWGGVGERYGDRL